MNRECNVTKQVQTSKRQWRYCLVVLSANGRIRKEAELNAINNGVPVASPEKNGHKLVSAAVTEFLLFPMIVFLHSYGKILGLRRTVVLIRSRRCRSSRCILRSQLICFCGFLPREFAFPQPRVDLRQ